MITSLRLSSFKCFEHLSLPLRPLSVLTGHNSGGKSSVIQAMALLSQTFRESEWGNLLLLNGPDISLGSAADVLNQTNGGRELEIGFSTARQNVVWTFRPSDRRALSLTADAVSLDGIKTDLPKDLRWLLPRQAAEQSEVVSALRRIKWITAERVGPRELLPLLDPDHHSAVGVRGELAAGLLYWRDAESVLDALCIDGEINTLFHQVRAWMRRFFPGSDIRLSPVEGANAITLQMRSNNRSDFQRPQNLGFGLSQLLPVLVAVLSATPGDILLVENPEVHLHPRAQQDIGFLLAQVGATGIQVVLETHSDHVLNGVRLATRQSRISSEDVVVHFFSRDPVDGSLTQTSPVIDADGRFSDWPAGFFDQYDAALSELM